MASATDSCDNIREMLSVRPILGNSQRLDGGAMFGNAPRVLWQRWAPPDDEGRIDLACRALLAHDGERTILLETGIGAFFPPKLRKRYGIVESEHVLLSSLAGAGLEHTDIDVVVLSHLHFDHAGGLFAPYEEGRDLRLLFDRARYVVGRRAFERARDPHPRDRASFIVELPQLLIDSGRLELVDDERDLQRILGDRFSCRFTEGHTPGMLHLRIQGRQDAVFFCADLVPGRPWIHPPITMGYDRFPERLVEEKTSILEDLARDGTWLFFTHDPKVFAARVEASDGRFAATDERSEETVWDLDG